MEKAPSSSVEIVEVGPRDGLQNIAEFIPTSVKQELISRLRLAGLRAIELTSLVSPRAVPQLADGRELLEHPHIQGLLADTSLRLPVLVPNIKGLDVALQRGVREVAVFVSATEGFSRVNTNCTRRQGVERAKEVVVRAQEFGISVRGYVSCIFSDPYDGPTEPSSVLSCVKELLAMGCHEISLGDTLGTGSPRDVRKLLTYLKDNGIPMSRLAGHFHDTHGNAVANVWEAYHCGLRVFDSSVNGLGGCPFAPGARGNVATEDLLYLFMKAGIDTGIDISKVVDTGAWVSGMLGDQLGCNSCSQP
ncbi:hydroxymethylglutaryl-CoA lyase [Aspergillus lucknowensis]|uniref:hydroxymethylglutaryl-CoA lyase n=1 Tax=Aspergillus lucknowensis TaxID=176173 RepID=A0ABR4LNU9_9EURO